MPITRRAFSSLLTTAPAAFAASPKRPNLLVILADDLGYSDIGPFGGEIATPNLDALARNGVRFTQFYNCARCCPTRAALLTGLYNHQAGVGHMIQNRRVPAYQGYLNDRCATIAESLKPAGYSTLMSGKWHVGEDPDHWPTRRGFDHYFGLISGASNYFRLEEPRRMALDAQPYVPPPNAAGTKVGFYMTNAIGDHAVRMLREAPKDNPFFLYLAFTSPHWPLHALPEDISRYRGKYLRGWDRLRLERHERQLAAGIVDRRWPLSPRDAGVPAWDTLSQSEKDQWDLRMAVYAAQVDCMDRNIGRVLGQLRQSGQLDNTMVMFLADNGGCAEENIGGEAKAKDPIPGGPDSFTSYRRPWANSSNTPFRLWKQFTHEGGISSPFIASWPAGFRRSGQLDSTPGHVIDVLPTLLDAAGAARPTQIQGRELLPLEGRSLLPAFRGAKAAVRPVTGWEHQGHRAVRMGEWKLVSTYRKPWELYNLDADRTELQDLKSKDPGRATAMAAEYDKWAAHCGVESWEKLNAKG
ncbi:MAG: arylsulfatase [Acidobacteria bacterium]|nr:arylsulfatase [Acidobacteriota bacterium]